MANTIPVFGVTGSLQGNRPMMRPPSEADQGSMAGYDPNLGLGQAGYGQATAIPPFDPRSIQPQVQTPQNTNSTIPFQGQVNALRGMIR